MAKNDNRLFNFEDINKEVIHAIFLGYNTGFNVQNIFPITTGMSTSNYMVEANDNKYLLKFILRIMIIVLLS